MVAFLLESVPTSVRNLCILILVTHSSWEVLQRCTGTEPATYPELRYDMSPLTNLVLELLHRFFMHGQERPLRETFQVSVDGIRNDPSVTGRHMLAVRYYQACCTVPTDGTAHSEWRKRIPLDRVWSAQS